MKKFFRKSLACIIAVMMIATSLPFSAITAGAETSTTPINMNAFGAFKNGSANRVGADYVSTCNDGQNTNFVMAVFTFDVSSLTVGSTDDVSAVFNYYVQCTQNENKGISFYYPTQHLDEFNIANQYEGQPNNSIWTGDDSNHLSRATNYYGLESLSLGLDAPTERSNRQLQIGPAIKSAKKFGNSRAIVVGVIASAGQSGSGGGGWTDTSIGYTNQSVTVNVTPDSLSDKEYIQAHINDVLPTYSDISSSQLVGASNIPSEYIKGVKSIGTFNGEPITNKINDFDDTSSYNNFKIFGFNNPIAVYTGDGCVIRVPVNSENASGGNKTGVSNYVGIDHLSITNSNFSLGIDTWKRSASYNNFADNTDVTHDFSSASNGNVGRTENSASNRFSVTDTKSWRNYITYTGTGNTDTYYDSISSISYDYQADYTWSWGVFTKSWGSKSNYTKTLSSNNSLYVINYAPLKSIIDKDLKKDYETISANEQIYTGDSLAKYYKAVANILKFDLMYGVSAYSSDVQNAVAKKGEEIKNLVDSYDLPVKKVFTVTFKDYYGNVKDTKDILYGSKIGAFPENTAPINYKDPTAFINPGQHINIKWPTTYNADTEVKSNITIQEIGTTESCYGSTATCTKRPVCTVCRLEFGAIDPNNHDPIYNFKDYTNHIKTCSRCDLNVEEPHTNNGSGYCQYCGHVLLDTSTLDSAKRQANDILTVGNADGKYVADTYQKLYDVYNSIKDVVPTSEDEVNSLTSELLEAISSLISAEITITFTKAENGTQVGETQTINAKYGDPVEIPVNDGDVEMWEIVNREDKDNKVVSYVRTGENTLSIVVSENISVIAHLAVNSTSQQQNITKVVFMGRNKNVLAIKYIEAGKSFATSDVPIPAIPFYSENGWDKTEVVGLENGGEITVRAKYTFDGQETDKCGIHYDGFEGKVRKYNYDSFVKLYNSSEYFGMYEDEAKTKLLTYFKTDEFYAPHNPNIYVAPVDASAVTASVGVTGSYQENYDTKDVAAFNCKFFVPDDAKIVEWGIKATAGGQTRTFKSNNKTSRNEYTFKVNVANDANISSIRAKAYIIYIDGAGKRTTLLSNNEVAINFN